MGSSDREADSRETLQSLSIVVGMALLFFIWGLTIFFTVGDKGSPSWDFGTVQDIPGESPYSTQRINEVADLSPLSVESRVVVDQQHVDKSPREAGKVQGGKTMMSIRFQMLKDPVVRGMLWGVTMLLMVPMLWGCDYGRMYEDDAIHTYQTVMPEMPKRTTPIGGGIQILRMAKPDELLNPVAFGRESVQRGREAYGYYCIQCHGPNVDGRGTVGQSFAPLPANLKDPNVQDQSDGSLFYRISLGFNRHPPLWDTVAEHDRWAVVNYIRSLVRPESS
jgi:hypothetical protein